MSEEPQHEPTTESHSGKPAPVIHRVCVTCNNMFRVSPENYDAKQCPNCHKAG
jgi:hypothetical protein